MGLEREGEALTGLGGSGAGQHDDGADKARAGEFVEGPVFLGEAAVLEGGPVDLFGKEVAGPEEGGAGDGGVAVAEVEDEAGGGAHGLEGLGDGDVGVFEEAEAADGDGGGAVGEGDGSDAEVVLLVDREPGDGGWRRGGVVDGGEFDGGPVVTDGEGEFGGEASGEEGRDGEPFGGALAETGGEAGGLDGVNVAGFEVRCGGELNAADGGGDEQEFVVRGEPEQGDGEDGKAEAQLTRRCG